MGCPNINYFPTRLMEGLLFQTAIKLHSAYKSKYVLSVAVTSLTLGATAYMLSKRNKSTLLN
jgi:hypothetical protein